MTASRILGIVLFMVAGPLILRGQWVAMKSDADSLLRSGAQFIYNLKFNQAHANFTEVIRRYPENPAGYFLDAMIEFWQIRLDRSARGYDQKFLDKIDQVLSVCERRLEKDPYDVGALFFKGGAIGYRAQFYAQRESYLNAVTDGKTGLDILVQCYQLAPGNHDIMLGTGIFDYFAEAIPERNPILKPLMAFVPSGDKRMGILRLEAASRKARYANVEAEVVLLQIYYDWEKDYAKAKTLAKSLVDRYPDNSYFLRYYGRALISAGPMDSAETVWRRLLVQFMDKSFGHDRHLAREALYYVGLCRMIAGDHDWALKYFYKADEASRVLDQDPSGFMVKTNLKIGQIYDLQGKRDLALRQYEKVLNWENKGGSHEEAQRYRQEPYRR